LQGHRKRRRTIEVREKATKEHEVSWVDYKIMKQYKPLGEILDSMRLYGYRGGIEEIINKAWNPAEDGFQDWTASGKKKTK